MALTAVLLSGAALSAEPALQTEAGLHQWMTYYYLKPDPGNFVPAVNYMASSGLLENENALAPLFGFVAGVVRSNPSKLTTWIKELGPLNDAQLGAVVLGVWYANLPQSQKLVYSLLEQRPGLKEKQGFLLQGSPMPITKIPLEEGSWVLDANWGTFMATGEREPVLRIISTLPWLEVKGDVNRLLIGGAARWSLTSNAVQHKKVLDICESEIPKQPKEVAEKLREVVANAKKELQSGPNK